MTEFLARQMAELTEEEQRAVTVAAVLGKEFSFPFLLRASGEPEERLAEITERLSSRGILREQPDERFEFVRDDLRLQIYSDLTETRRRLLHRRAAEALEATGTADAATIYALARHFQLGRVEDKSALYNRLAGDFAARSFTPEVARDHYARALDSLRQATPYDAEGELELMIELAIQLDRVGELQAAERCLRDVLARPKLVQIARPTQKALLHLSLARILYDQGRMDDANHLTMELLARYDPEAGPIPSSPSTGSGARCSTTSASTRNRSTRPTRRSRSPGPSTMPARSRSPPSAGPTCSASSRPVPRGGRGRAPRGGGARAARGPRRGRVRPDVPGRPDEPARPRRRRAPGARERGPLGGERARPAPDRLGALQSRRPVAGDRTGLGGPGPERTRPPRSWSTSGTGSASSNPVSSRGRSCSVWGRPRTPRSSSSRPIA